MAMADGDYRQVEVKVAATLLADDGEGGLFEQGSPPVAAVVTGDVESAASMAQSMFPLILVRAAGKTESPAGPSFSIVKTFRVVLTVIDRGMDRRAMEESVRRIASRAESVFRSQTATSRQFQGLPDFIEGAEGVLVASVARTVLPETVATPERVTAQAMVEAEISVPCVYRYE